MIAPPVERIVLSQQMKDQLVSIKRKTGITQWNQLCRWALCLSLKEQASPAPMEVPADSNVEMSWKVFAGDYDEMISGLLHVAFTEDEMASDFSVFLRLHLSRGVGYLASAVSSS